MLAVWALSAEAQPLERAAVLASMERVADWQLEHPCYVDLRWRSAKNTGFEHMRIDWSGAVVRRRSVGSVPAAHPALTSPWATLVSWTGRDFPFIALPAAVRSTWQRETGLDSSALVSVQLGEEGGTRGWEMGTLYYGMRALANISTRVEYGTALDTIAEANQWALGPRLYHADDQIVGALYLDCYMRKKRVEMLA
ncbi:MAG TPA: hypothetical protein VKC60_16440, partial [Opitutaceae bacterium]|nr:hypothetical protein [Opitutaceae bacterium]